MSESVSANAAFLPAIVTVATVGVAMSVVLPLLSLEMERMGVSSTVQGLQTAIGGLANIVAVPFVPGLAARFGVRPLLLASLMLITIGVLAFKLIPSLAAWFAIRVVYGAALGAMFVLSEYWIVSTATAARRGFIMGAYATVLSLGFAAGPALLALTGSHGWTPYLAAAGLSLAGLVPLLLTSARPPPPTGDRKEARVLAMIRVAPAATLAAFVVGAIETAGVAHLAVIGVRGGLGDSVGALLVSVFAAGNVASQIPMGLLADRFDKHRLLVALAVVGLAAILAFAAAVPNVPVSMACLFIAGGAVGALYTVGLATMGARFTGIELASANAAFVILYSSGLTFGPFLAGAGLDAAGTTGFAAALALLLVGFLAITSRDVRTA
jgi:MFS family permease